MDAVYDLMGVVYDLMGVVYDLMGVVYDIMGVVHHIMGVVHHIMGVVHHIMDGLPDVMNHVQDILCSVRDFRRSVAGTRLCSPVQASQLEASALPDTIRLVKIFAYSKTDAIPVLAGIFHAVCLVAVFRYFPVMPWWAVLICGLLFSISISWNINGISHNFLHNPYFASPVLNRAFSWLESVTIGFSQQFYECVHQQHHKGNSDHQDEKGETIDWLSIYRFGKDGEAENAWSYTFLSFFRDDPKAIYRELKRRNPADARFGLFEIFSFVALLATGFILNWRFMLCFYLPFWYFGHCLSYLNGYYRHFGGNPEVPIAWGVSSYHRLYNLIWFNNGYHAEHHFRPKMHWTKMRQVHEQFAEEQKRAGVRVIRPPHALGFLDPDLPEKSRPLVPVQPKGS